MDVSGTYQSALPNVLVAIKLFPLSHALKAPYPCSIFQTQLDLEAGNSSLLKHLPHMFAHKDPLCEPYMTIAAMKP